MIQRTQIVWSSLFQPGTIGKIGKSIDSQIRASMPTASPKISSQYHGKLFRVLADAQNCPWQQRTCARRLVDVRVPERVATSVWHVVSVESLYYCVF
eukprot:2196747-Pleurochrysis_carterae.AAC.3